MYTLSSFRDSKAKGLSAARGAIRKLEQELGKKSQLMANCFGFSDRNVIDALKELGYNPVGNYLEEGVVRFENSGSETVALLGYLPVPKCNRNTNFLVLELAKTA